MVLVPLTLMLLVVNLANTKLCEKLFKMTETLENGYSLDSTPRELSNEYQHIRIQMVFQKILRPCALDKSRLSIGRVKARSTNV